MKANWEIHWKDYYKILQIDPLAEPEVVKVAYDRLARKYHPDLNKDATSVGRMKDLNEALEILNDPEKRGRYYLAYCQQAKSSSIITPPPKGIYSYSPRSETKAAASATSNDVRLDKWCNKCKKATSMRIALVDKKPAYAICPECHTYWDIRSQVQYSTQPSEPYDNSWEQLFVPLPSDTILQKRQKVINAIEYILATQQLGYWSKLGLRVQLDKLQKPSKVNPYNPLLDNNLYQDLSYIIQELNKEKAWQKLFKEYGKDGYYYVPTKNLR